MEIERVVLRLELKIRDNIYEEILNRNKKEYRGSSVSRNCLARICVCVCVLDGRIYSLFIENVDKFYKTVNKGPFVGKTIEYLKKGQVLGNNIHQNQSHLEVWNEKNNRYTK